MVGPKMQAFCHDHAMLKGNRCILRLRGAPVCQKVPKSYRQFSMSKIDGIFSKKSYDDLRFVKKCRNRTFGVNFLCQKLTEFFSKKNSFKNINLGDNFL